MARCLTTDGSKFGGKLAKWSCVWRQLDAMLATHVSTNFVSKTRISYSFPPSLQQVYIPPSAPGNSIPAAGQPLSFDFTIHNYLPALLPPPHTHTLIILLPFLSSVLSSTVAIQLYDRFYSMRLHILVHG